MKAIMWFYVLLCLVNITGTVLGIWAHHAVWLVFGNVAGGIYSAVSAFSFYGKASTK